MGAPKSPPVTLNCCTPPEDPEAWLALQERVEIVCLYLDSHYDVVWIPDSGVLNIVALDASPSPRLLTACARNSYVEYAAEKREEGIIRTVAKNFLTGIDIKLGHIWGNCEVIVGGVRYNAIVQKVVSLPPST